jgi:hypothetical protein
MGKVVMPFERCGSFVAKPACYQHGKCTTRLWATRDLNATSVNQPVRPLLAFGANGSRLGLPGASSRNLVGYIELWALFR